MRVLLKQGHIIDPANKVDGILDILINEGKISKIGKDIKSAAEEVIDASGKIILPGLVDMHVHLREPGREDKETIASGTKAAAKGGITSVLAMPNTLRAIDSTENIQRLKEIIKKDALINVFICAAITKNREGRELTDLCALQKEGAIAISDDGSSVDSSELMSLALKQAQDNKMQVICHCEDNVLSNAGVVNAGFTSTKMGLKGISKESEYKRVQRDISLAEKTQAALHIAHISCQESVDLIRQAKKKGVNITCETSPHYLVLSEKDVWDFDTNKKMNPPLRGKEDVLAIGQGLKDGTIDVIASDHAPHTDNEKNIEFERAEFGVVGLETELSIAITELVHTGILSWAEIVKKMSFNPAKVLGLSKGDLGMGNDADLTVVNPDKEWVVERKLLVSKSKNSAFLGRRLKGVVEYTLCSGKIIYKDGIHS